MLKFKTRSFFWTIFLAVSLLSTACDFASLSNEQTSPLDSSSKNPSNCGKWTTTGKAWKGLQLGLAALNGKSETIKDTVLLNCRKDVVIFVHGWSTDGIPSAFAHADAWQAKGFQTFAFRWHDLSSDLRYDTVFIENSTKAAVIMEAQMRELYSQLGGKNYKGEIRVVGHSFGAKLASDVVASLSPIGPAPGPSSTIAAAVLEYSVPIARLTLLDPAMFLNWEKGQISLCPKLKVRIEDGGKGSRPIVDEMNRIFGKLAFLPTTLKVEVFSTNVGSAFSYGLATRFPVQTLTHSSFLDCFINFEDLNIFEVHSSVVEGYLGSISEAAPMTRDGVRLLSASVPTNEINMTPGWHVITEGDPRKNWNTHRYVKKELPDDFLRLNFGKGCIPQDEAVTDCQVSVQFVYEF